MNKCPYCDNTIFNGQFRCDKCGKILPKEAPKEEKTVKAEKVKPKGDK